MEGSIKYRLRGIGDLRSMGDGGGDMGVLSMGCAVWGGGRIGDPWSLN